MLLWPVVSYSRFNLPQIHIHFENKDLVGFTRWEDVNKEKYKVSVKLDGIIYDDVKIKYKGHTTRHFPKRGLHLRFSDSGENTTLFKGMTAINLNPMYTDKSFVREKITWKIFEDMGGLGPRDYGYFQVYINNVDFGIYLVLPEINKDFLKLNNLKGDDIFEAEDDYKKSDLKPLGDEHLMETYEKKSGGEKGYPKLSRLIERLNETRNDNFTLFFENNFNTKTVHDWFLLNMLTMQGDSYVKNYFLHYEPGESKNWSIIPWDYDLTFGRDGNARDPYPLQVLNDLFSYSYPILSGPDNALKERLIKSPSQMSELREKLIAAYKTYASPARLEKLIDDFSKSIAENIKVDRYKWGTYEDFENQVDALKYYSWARFNYINSQFLNPQNNKLYDEASISNLKTSQLYSFVDGQGKTVAQVRLKEAHNLKSLRIKAYPSRSAPEIGEQDHIKRYIEIIAEPSIAKFKADLTWEYLDNSELTEVSSGALNDYGMSSYFYSDGRWSPVVSKINPYGNFVRLSIDQSQSGKNKYFTIKRQEKAIFPWIKVILPLWHRIYDSAYDHQKNIFAVADDGILLKSTDAGQTWSTHFIGSHTRLTTIDITKDNTIFIADQFGQILKSTDSGSTWKFVGEIQNESLNDLVFLNNKLGIAVGNNGLILITENGGNTWEKINFNKINLNKIVKTDDNKLYLGTDRGLYFSTDSGREWSNIKLKEQFKINNLYMDKNDHLWVVGDHGYLVQGQLIKNRWSFLYSGTEEDLTAVQISKSQIYIAGKNGYLASKNLYDSQWQQHNKKIMADYSSFLNDKNDQLFLFGSSGTILKSVN